MTDPETRKRDNTNDRWIFELETRIKALEERNPEPDPRDAEIAELKADLERACARADRHGAAAFQARNEHAEMEADRRQALARAEAAEAKLAKARELVVRFYDGVGNLCAEPECTEHEACRAWRDAVPFLKETRPDAAEVEPEKCATCGWTLSEHGPGGTCGDPKSSAQADEETEQPPAEPPEKATPPLSNEPPKQPLEEPAPARADEDKGCEDHFGARRSCGQCLDNVTQHMRNAQAEVTSLRAGLAGAEVAYEALERWREKTATERDAARALLRRVLDNTEHAGAHDAPMADIRKYLGEVGPKTFNAPGCRCAGCVNGETCRGES